VAVLISVLGTGYLGATHAACLTALGHQVVGVDVDSDRLSRLSRGKAPFHEPRLDDLLGAGVRSGRLRFTDDVREAARADVHFVCVGTPQLADADGTDLTALWSVVDDLAAHLHLPCLVVGKSTVPVGTAARVRDRLHRSAPAGADVGLAWNPEFLREGHAVEDSLRPDRLVLGVESDRDEALLRDVYAEPIAAGVPVIPTDLATAELAKVSANSMLAARVSLVNLLAEVCERSGADIAQLTAVLGSDPRIGDRFLSPGLGYGGGCLPKDTRAFAARASELGLGDPARLLGEVDRVNLRQRTRTTDLALDLLGGDATGRTVAVLGAAFKAGSDDIRDSPALDVARRLSARGAQVRVYDPRAGENVRRTTPELQVVTDAVDACTGADLVLVLTDWPEFAALDPDDLAPVVRRRCVLDARLLLDDRRWTSSGWEVRSLGRGRTEAGR
jgi:UDPglucose 6-dehydrogenase